MRLLLDTHVLLWAAAGSERISAELRAMLEDETNLLLFSAASIWEVAIKSALGRQDFQVDPALLRGGLLDNGYIEVPITGEHAVVFRTLPAIHGDPFDRMLAAQALVENAALVSADERPTRYPVTVVRA